MDWTYRHPPALKQTPSEALTRAMLAEARRLLAVGADEPITVLDSMAGGGVIPLEAVRYGFDVYTNDLNPVAALVLRATLKYPAQFGTQLLPAIEQQVHLIDERVRARLLPYFYTEPAEVWWRAEKDRITQELKAKSIVTREPADRDSSKNCILWVRLVSCPKCALRIPISTNFNLVTKKGQPDKAIAAFPDVPPIGHGNDCTFRIVKHGEWKTCRWPRPGFDHWHPRNTPTFKDGKAECPRCGATVDGDQVKAQGQAREGGLPAQMYAVVSQVPVQLTYRNGDVKVRYLWRFRAPTAEDLVAVQAAEEELARQLPQWEAQGLVPDEEIPVGEKTREPRNVGFRLWRDLFLPRQLLTNLVILEEIRAAQERVRTELPEDQAEAVAVYLAFMLDKVVNYNSVNTFWDYTRNKGAQTFSRHDFAFRAAFCEFEGARETMMWAANQVIDAYTALCALIHGGEVDLTGDDEDLDDSEDQASEDESAGDDLETDEEDLDETGTLHMHRAGNGALRPEVIVPDGDLRGRCGPVDTGTRNRPPDLRRSAVLQQCPVCRAFQLLLRLAQAVTEGLAPPRPSLHRAAGRDQP
jgi:putative DNA methylase